MKAKFLIATGVACFLPLTAQAAIISGYGVSASASTASNCPSYCTTAGGGDFQYDDDGGEFAISASAMQNSYALGESFASLSGSNLLPVLKVNASSDLGKGGNGGAFGVQGYSYSGAARTITLDFNLHGSVGDNADGYVFNRLSADIAVLKGSQLDWFPDFGTLVYEVSFGLENVGTESLSINGGTDINMPGSISFDIADGEDFYVIASLSATARNGYADGWNTLTLGFDDASGLSAASAVPVPAAVWLLGSGLLGLVGVARRKS